MAANIDKLSLINEALAGFSDYQLTSLEEVSFDAVQAFKTWDLAIREMLALHDWSFLIKDKVFNEREDNSDGEEYLYKYPLPDDFHRPIIVLNTYFEDVFYLVVNNWFKSRGNYLFSEYKIKYPYFFTNYKNNLYVTYSSNDIDNAFLTENFKLGLVYIMRREMALTKKNSIAIYDRYNARAEIEKRKARFEDIKQISVRYEEIRDVSHDMTVTL